MSKFYAVSYFNLPFYHKGRNNVVLQNMNMNMRIWSMQ